VQVPNRDDVIQLDAERDHLRHDLGPNTAQHTAGPEQRGRARERDEISSRALVDRRRAGQIDDDVASSGPADLGERALGDRRGALLIEAADDRQREYPRPNL
jgi:hypothetical protein